MIEILIKPSKKADKKFDAVIDGNKTVSFGAKGYSDFTQHKDPARKQLYLKRHKARENWTEPTTAGSLGKMYYGINKAYQQVWQIWTNNL